LNWVRLDELRQNKNLLYRHDRSNEPNKEGPLSYVLFESPFTSVSTVSRGHPSIISLSRTLNHLQEMKAFASAREKQEGRGTTEDH